MGRGDGASGIIAVSEQDQDFFLLLGLFEQFDTQANGITQCRIRAGHTDADFIQQHLKTGVIQGKGRLRIGARAEHDQANAIILALCDEITHNPLHCGQTIALSAVGVGVILRLHGL
ncbi:hypothetical protein D9M71_601000 [compost metagenome]